MHKWTYEISRHRLEDILRVMEERGFVERDSGSRVLFCDSEGGCYFDEFPELYRCAVREVMPPEAWEMYRGFRCVRCLERQRQPPVDSESVTGRPRRNS